MLKFKFKLNANYDLLYVEKILYYGLGSGLITIVADNHDKWWPFEDFNNPPWKITIFAMFGNKKKHGAKSNNHFPLFSS